MNDEEQNETALIEYYKAYIAECTRAREYYKNEQNKLLYWMGTVFVVGVVTSSGIFNLGSASSESVTSRISIAHIAMLVGAFTVAWLYYKHKQMAADTFAYLGSKIERTLRQKYNIDDATPLPAYFSIKDRYIGKTMMGGRGLSKAAVLLMIVMVAIAIIYPISKVQVNWDGLSIDTGSVVVIVVLIGAIVISEFYYKKANKRMKQLMDEDWSKWDPGNKARDE